MTNHKHIAILSEVMGTSHERLINIINCVDRVSGDSFQMLIMEALAAMQKVEEEAKKDLFTKEDIISLLNRVGKTGWYFEEKKERWEHADQHGYLTTESLFEMYKPTAPAEKVEEPTKDTPVVDLEPKKGATDGQE